MNYLIKLTAIAPAICFNSAKNKFLKLCQKKNPPVQVSKFVVQKNIIDLPILPLTNRKILERLVTSANNHLV